MSALSGIIQDFECETFGLTRNLDELKRELRNTSIDNEYRITKTSYKALLLLDRLVWDIVDFDNSLIRSTRRWPVTQILLMASGLWCGKSHVNLMLQLSIQNVEIAWDGAASVAGLAFDQAIELTSKVSRLRDSLAIQQDYLGTAITTWETEYSHATGKLKNLERIMEDTEMELRKAKAKVNSAEMFKEISDIKHSMIQNFFSATSLAGEKFTLTAVGSLLSTISLAAETTSQRSQEEYSKYFKLKQGLLEANVTKVKHDIETIQNQIREFESNTKTHAYYKPQLKAWQAITDHMSDSIQILYQEANFRKNSSLRLVVKLREVLTHWEDTRYFEVRADVLCVLASVLKSIEDDGSLVLLHGKRGLRLYKSLRQGTDWLELRTKDIECLDDGSDDSQLVEIGRLLNSIFYALISCAVIVIFLVDFWSGLK